ncbi:hypothetical protein SISNIDRAFT_404485, partial [Sistotremastrum niveocremeum HHB9708]
RLQGIIYHGSHHFTVRVIDKWGNVWYNDGMAMGTQFVKERTGINLTQARSRNACLVFESRVKLGYGHLRGPNRNLTAVILGGFAVTYNRQRSRLSQNWLTMT